MNNVIMRGYAHYSPLSVAILLDIVLAFSKGVPELDCPVTRARDNLSVVSAEADGKDIRGVADETAGSETGVEVPEAEGVVPRGGERELAVGGDDDVRDEVVVSVEDALRVTVLVLIPSQCPDDYRLVCTRGEQVRAPHEERRRTYHGRQ